MSEPQYDAKFGEVYNGIDRNGATDSLRVMVIGVDTSVGEAVDYLTIYLTGEPEVVRWGLYREHWVRVDEED